MLRASVFQSEVNIGDPVLFYYFSKIIIIKVPNCLKAPKKISLIKDLAERQKKEWNEHISYVNVVVIFFINSLPGIPFPPYVTKTFVKRSPYPHYEWKIAMQTDAYPRESYQKHGIENWDVTKQDYMKGFQTAANTKWGH